jgi:hypothetical protein
VPIFTLTVAHEIAHVVDARVVQADARLEARNRELIRRATGEPRQYLRSIVQGLSPGFFGRFPQEFFASIANMWYVNPELTIEVARLRWEQGRREPMNQVAFFLDVLAQEGPSIRIPRADASGDLTATSGNVVRNAGGLATRLNAPGYSLTLSQTADGLVSANTYEPR